MPLLGWTVVHMRQSAITRSGVPISQKVAPSRSAVAQRLKGRAEVVMARQPKGLLPTRKHRDYTGRIVTGCLAVIAFAMFMGWYLREGLTPEQIELLKARRAAMALSVAEPPPNKKKWAQ